MSDMKEQILRPFDIVRCCKHGDTSIGMVTEVSGNNTCSVDWFVNDANMHNAWINAMQLTILGNCMNAIARAMSHPMGNGTKHSDLMFPMNVAGKVVPYQNADGR